MKTSEAGIEFIEKREGLRLSQYLDNGHQCIGYGHDLLPGESYPNGISTLTAQLILEEDVEKCEQAINAYGVPLTQNQFDALVDFTFNLGVRSLWELLAHGLSQVPEQLPRWMHENGKVSTELLDRRQAEVKLFKQV